MILNLAPMITMMLNQFDNKSLAVALVAGVVYMLRVVAASDAGLAGGAKVGCIWCGPWAQPLESAGVASAVVSAVG